MSTSEPNARVMPRRRAYTAPYHRQDYFVAKYLRDFLSRAVKHHVRAGSRVCDVGCGEQPLREWVEAAGGRYLGVDVVQNSFGSVATLNEITRLPFADATFDVVLCTEVLEHVSDTYGAFDALARVLKPGGTLILTVPFAYPLHEEPHDYARLTPYQIEACAARSGLNVVELERSGNEIEAVAHMLDQAWLRSMSFNPNALQRAWLMGSRLLANSFAVVTGKLVGKHLPRKFFLSVLCVLRRQNSE